MAKRSLADQIKGAQRRISETKKCAPYVFVEYVELKRAEVELNKAQRKYNLAKEKWDKLGEEKPQFTPPLQVYTK